MWNLINLVFYLGYKQNTKWFSEKSAAIFMGFLGCILIFTFVTGQIVLLISQFRDFTNSNTNWLPIVFISINGAIIFYLLVNRKFNSIIERFDKETAKQKTTRFIVTGSFAFIVVILFYANLMLMTG